VKILIKKVKQQKVISEKRTLLSFLDGSSMMIRAGDYNTTRIDYKDKTLVLFEFFSKTQQIVVTRLLDDDFSIDDYSDLLRRNKEGRFEYAYTIDGSFWLRYYYGGDKAVDYREGAPKEVIISKG
jgi:hypothetical protein